MKSVAPRYDYILSTDGSGNPGGSGGAACIVEVGSSPRKQKFVGFLGASTGNEAEIMAAFLGFSIIGELKLKQELEQGFCSQVLWQTDSTYLIRSWTLLTEKRGKKQNFPNLSMWEALLQKATHVHVTAVHVRARSGNRRNEACDHASRWIQRSGERLLRDCGETKIGRLKETVPGEAWELLDLRALSCAFKANESNIIIKKVDELTHKLRQCVHQ